MTPKKPRLPKERNVIQQSLIERGTAGAGRHKNKQDYERGRARQPKHKGLEREAGVELLPYERALAESAKAASNTRKKACGENCGCGCGGGKPAAHHPEGGSYMSTQALRGMIDHASDLLEGIDDSTPLPDWVEAKITEAATQLTNVYEYMAHGHSQKYASEALSERYYHVEYPNPYTVRLLVYHPRHSSFFEARANASAPKVLAQKLADVGFFVTEEQMEEAIEQA